MAKSKSVSLYLTERTMSALRPRESVSARMNQAVDRYLTILESANVAARAYFSAEQWQELRAADARRQKHINALDDAGMLVASLGNSDLATALTHMPVWQAMVVLEILEQDAAGSPATHS